jgi:hypothetical protein
MQQDRFLASLLINKWREIGRAIYFSSIGGGKRGDSAVTLTG